MNTASTWRMCIDFGTAASKISVYAPAGQAPAASERIRPLKIGSLAREAHPFLAQSALLFHGQRIYFGAHAAERHMGDDVDVELLQSFKMFLAAPDLEASLALSLRRTVDPSGRFSHRDALVLYASYLLALAQTAIAQDTLLSDADSAGLMRRYAYPLWRGAAANAIMARVFNEAEACARELQGALLSSEGVPLDAAEQALSNARLRPGDGRMEAGVFEARAAAEPHFFAQNAAPRHLMVFDMGAGTTDISLFAPSEDKTGASPVEIEAARITAPMGCDVLDDLLVAAFIDRAISERTKGARRRFYRRLKARARKLKEALFTHGECEALYEGNRIVIKRHDFMRRSDFKGYALELKRLFVHGLTRLAQIAAEQKADRIAILLAGGGAKLHFIERMAADAMPLGKKPKHIDLYPAVPAWVEGHDEAALIQSSFSQIAISIGGALAPLRPDEALF